MCGEVERSFQPDRWILIIFIFRAFMCIACSGGTQKRIEQRTARPAAPEKRYGIATDGGQSRARAARWMVCRLGIGIPTLVACFLKASKSRCNRNGMLGMGPFPIEGEDPDLINTGKQTIMMSTVF